jgi:hypothetical protein
MTTYTVAYVADALLAIVPDGEDIEAAIHVVEEYTGEAAPGHKVETGCTATNDLSAEDHVIFASPHGCCGFITVREGDADVSYDYVVRKSIHQMTTLRQPSTSTQVPRANEKLHSFPGMLCVTYLQPDGCYAAHDRDYDLGALVGHGRTREAALEDLADLMDETGASR